MMPFYERWVLASLRGSDAWRSRINRHSEQTSLPAQLVCRYFDGMLAIVELSIRYCVRIIW
jgi:hypothetical protein